MKDVRTERRRSANVDEYRIPFQSYGLGIIAIGVALLVVGAGALWLLLMVGWHTKRQPGIVLDYTLKAIAGLLSLAGAVALIAGGATCRRANRPRVLRVDHLGRVVELDGFDPGRFALLIPRLRTPRAHATIPFDELELAGVRVFHHRFGRTEAFYLSTRKQTFIIGDLSGDAELKHALGECDAIISARRSSNRDLDFGDAPRPMSEGVIYALAIVGGFVVFGMIWALWEWLDPI